MHTFAEHAGCLCLGADGVLPAPHPQPLAPVSGGRDLKATRGDESPVCHHRTQERTPSTGEGLRSGSCLFSAYLPFRRHFCPKLRPEFGMRPASFGTNSAPSPLVPRINLDTMEQLSCGRQSETLQTWPELPERPGHRSPPAGPEVKRATVATGHSGWDSHGQVALLPPHHGARQEGKRRLIVLNL